MCVLAWTKFMTPSIRPFFAPKPQHDILTDLQTHMLTLPLLFLKVQPNLGLRRTVALVRYERKKKCLGPHFFLYNLQWISEFSLLHSPTQRVSPDHSSARWYQTRARSFTCQLVYRLPLVGGGPMAFFILAKRYDRVEIQGVEENYGEFLISGMLWKSEDGNEFMPACIDRPFDGMQCDRSHPEWRGASPLKKKYFFVMS